jgi:hypothetical protein
MSKAVDVPEVVVEVRGTDVVLKIPKHGELSFCVADALDIAEAIRKAAFYAARASIGRA